MDQWTKVLVNSEKVTIWGSSPQCFSTWGDCFPLFLDKPAFVKSMFASFLVYIATFF